MKYAVIKSGSKQYKVFEGKTVVLDNLNSDINKVVELSDVLLLVDEDKVEIGRPVLTAKVHATVLENKKTPKIRVYKYKAKTGYHKTYGARQSKTLVRIDKIEGVKKTTKYGA